MEDKITEIALALGFQATGKGKYEKINGEYFFYDDSTVTLPSNAVLPANDAYDYFCRVLRLREEYDAIREPLISPNHRHIWYHGSDTPSIELSENRPLCLTEHAHVACLYGKEVHTFQVSNFARITPIGVVRDLYGDDYYYDFELMDRKETREGLKAKGIQGVVYDDVTDCEEYEHRTLCVLDTDILFVA